MVLTPERIANMEKYIDKAKLDTPGVISRAEAEELFKTARIDPLRGQHLWNMLDSTGAGVLTRPFFVVLLYFISRTKANEHVDAMPEDCQAYLQVHIDRMEEEAAAQKRFQEALTVLNTLVGTLTEDQKTREREEEARITSLEHEVS